MDSIYSPKQIEDLNTLIVIHANCTHLRNLIQDIINESDLCAKRDMLYALTPAISSVQKRLSSIERR